MQMILKTQLECGFHFRRSNQPCPSARTQHNRAESDSVALVINSCWPILSVGITFQASFLRVNRYTIPALEEKNHETPNHSAARPHGWLSLALSLLRRRSHGVPAGMRVLYSVRDHRRPILAELAKFFATTLRSGCETHRSSPPTLGGTSMTTDGPTSRKKERAPRRTHLERALATDEKFFARRASLSEQDQLSVEAFALRPAHAT